MNPQERICAITVQSKLDTILNTNKIIYSASYIRFNLYNYYLFRNDSFTGTWPCVMLVLIRYYVYKATTHCIIIHSARLESGRQRCESLHVSSHYPSKCDHFLWVIGNY